MTTTRHDGRAPDQLRPITFQRDFTDASAGSVLVSFGRTRVLCTVSLDEDVPRWMKGRGKGWVTAEYSMLPGSSAERIRREVKDGKPSGRRQRRQRPASGSVVEGGGHLVMRRHLTVGRQLVDDAGQGG